MRFILRFTNQLPDYCVTVHEQPFGLYFFCVIFNTTCVSALASFRVYR